MLSQDCDAHMRFGIDEVYFHTGLTQDLLQKLYQRARLSLDGENHIVQKHVTHDMILIFHKQEPINSLIYQFLKSIDQQRDKKNYIESNTLLNEEELFSAIKSKTFVLVTHRVLLKDI